MSKIKLQRFDDWEDRLRTYLDTCAEKKFEWGKHDCTLFAASSVQRVTGHDFAEALRGTYADAKGAALVLREHGAGTLLKTVSECLGRHRHVAFAKRGDVVMHNGSLGICAGSMSLFVGSRDDFGQLLPPDDLGKTREGLIPWPTLSCDRCWPVAH